MSSGEECHVISFHVKYVFARRQFEAVKKFEWNWNNFQWLSTINSRQRSESNYFCANFSPTQVKWGHKAQTAKQKERKHIIRVVFNIDQTSYVYYNILLQMVPLGSSSSYARPVPMNGNDCRTGWMNDWMDSPFWLKPSMLRSIQVRTNEWDSVLDCNEMGRSRKSPSLKSTWQQLICVARSLVVISIHSPHFSRQDCMSIRTKKGNFQLVLVSFKRHECDASLLLSKPMHCSQAESQETQSPICFALLSPCQPPLYHHPRVACVKGKDEIMAPHPFHFASTQHHLLEQVYLYSSHSHSLPAVDIPYVCLLSCVALYTGWALFLSALLVCRFILIILHVASSYVTLQK